eukprot:TRINITY_DN2097_c0_g1_i3.p2 TRINITY_DN2097_c0_g1~~TRINITY_DN2097_c0_g1_i3.p2  ORF type:complete len:172 (+),score=25.22 TRINITY_DN2097_c0_g1_i3:247-762(+)
MIISGQYSSLDMIFAGLLGMNLFLSAFSLIVLLAKKETYESLINCLGILYEFYLYALIIIEMVLLFAFTVCFLLRNVKGFFKEFAYYFMVGSIIVAVQLGLYSGMVLPLKKLYNKYMRLPVLSKGPLFISFQNSHTSWKAVSYTHLTLPTILLVQISVVAVSLKKKNIQNQ